MAYQVQERLSALGLYGLMSSAVREDARNIGIRMALGATPCVATSAPYLRNRHGRIAGALMASRLLTSQLYNVSPWDPVALVSPCAVLIAAALLAAFLPANRATRIDPAQALRAD